MSSSAVRAGDDSAEETAPGLRMLREIWHINTKPVRNDTAPEKVNSDIYNMPATSRRVTHKPRTTH